MPTSTVKNPYGQFVTNWDALIQEYRAKLLQKISEDELSALASLGDAVADFVSDMQTGPFQALSREMDREQLAELLFELNAELQHLKDHIDVAHSSLFLLYELSEPEDVP